MLALCSDFVGQLTYFAFFDLLESESVFTGFLDFPHEFIFFFRQVIHSTKHFFLKFSSFIVLFVINPWWTSLFAAFKLSCAICNLISIIFRSIDFVFVEGPGSFFKNRTCLYLNWQILLRYSFLCQRGIWRFSWWAWGRERLSDKTSSLD